MVSRDEDFEPRARTKQLGNHLCDVLRRGLRLAPAKLARTRLSTLSTGINEKNAEGIQSSVCPIRKPSAGANLTLWKRAAYSFHSTVRRNTESFDSMTICMKV